MEFKIPDKLTFRRKEVVNLTKLDGRVIDYWQKEFRAYSPVINKVGEKFYTRTDLELIMIIKQLLIVEKKDKSRVKELLRKEITNSIEVESLDSKQKLDVNKLKIIKKGLKEILTILDKNDRK